MKVSLESIIEVISHFVLRTRGKSSKTIVADTKLFQEGFIDSFGLVELIVELERVADRPIPDGALMPDDFETPRVLHTRLQEI